MPFSHVLKIQQAAEDVAQEAYKKLISENVQHFEAVKIIQTNFDRVNNDPLLILTVEELCDR